MTKAGDRFVKFCEKLNQLPAQFLCVFLFLVQAATLNYFMISNLSYAHFTWLAPDSVNLVLLVACMFVSYRELDECTNHEKNGYSLAWASWFVMNAIVAAKTIVIFNEIADTLEEESPSFFGPNTLKTSIALSSCIFALLLRTQHNAPLGSQRQLYIDELTGIVVFDILDTVDILEILFDGDKTDTFWDGLYEFILAVATLNLLIPTVPLLILSKTKFGHDKLQKHLVYAHRLMLVLAVNVPNLLVRFIIWHGFSGAISPFSLKNIILICMTCYEFYLHKKEKYNEHLKERLQMGNENMNNVKKSDSSDAKSDESPNEEESYADENFRMQSRIETYI